MPNGQGIEKETFVGADEKTRIAMTFDLLHEIHEQQCSQIAKCEKRFKPLEKSKKLNTAVSSGSGVIGGLIAVIGKTLLMK